MLVAMGWGMSALLVLISIIINPDYQEAKQRTSSALAAVPGDIWLGLGFVLLGMLWGDTIRTEVQPQTGSWIFITVVNFAIVWDLVGRLSRATWIREPSMIISPPMWLVFGLLPVAFERGDYAPLGLAGRRVGLLFAAMLILIGWAMWRDRRRSLTQADNSAGAPSA